jgi:hypothetical protein
VSIHAIQLQSQISPAELQEVLTRIHPSGALRPDLGDHLLDHLPVSEVRMVFEELIPGR